MLSNILISSAIQKWTRLQKQFKGKLCCYVRLDSNLFSSFFTLVFLSVFKAHKMGFLSSRTGPYLDDHFRVICATKLNLFCPPCFMSETPINTQLDLLEKKQTALRERDKADIIVIVQR